jgi:hypothetical protein
VIFIEVFKHILGLPLESHRQGNIELSLNGFNFENLPDPVKQDAKFFKRQDQAARAKAAQMAKERGEKYVEPAPKTFKTIPSKGYTVWLVYLLYPQFFYHRSLGSFLSFLQGFR